MVTKYLSSYPNEPSKQSIGKTFVGAYINCLKPIFALALAIHVNNYPTYHIPF